MDLELATKTLQAVKMFLCEHHVDWERLSPRTGRPLFDNEDAATLFAACCAILNDESYPTIEGTVRIGGVPMQAGAVLELGNALAAGMRRKDAATN